MAPAQTVFVRPLGYDEGEPVVRRIGDRGLYLGNRHAAMTEGAAFAHVLTLTADPTPATTRHCPLVDGKGNEWAAFERAVDAARELYAREGTTLVHCAHGISRSSAVLATTIAAVEDRSFHEALALVQDERPHATPHPHLHQQAVVYLASRPR